MAAVLTCSAMRCFTSRVVWPTLSETRVGLDRQSSRRRCAAGLPAWAQGFPRWSYSSSPRQRQVHRTDHVLDEGMLVRGDAVLLVELGVGPGFGPIAGSGTKRIYPTVASGLAFAAETRNRNSLVADVRLNILRLSSRSRDGPTTGRSQYRRTPGSPTIGLPSTTVRYVRCSLPAERSGDETPSNRQSDFSRSL